MLAMAAAPGLSCASCAAVAVLVTSIVRAVRQVPGQPVAALRQRLWPAVDFLTSARGQRPKQMVVDPQLHLAADLHRQCRVNMSSVSATRPSVEFSSGTRPNCGLPSVDFLEHGGDACRPGPIPRFGQNGGSPPGGCRCMPGPDKRRAVPVQRPRAADQLAKNAAHAAGCQAGPRLNSATRASTSSSRAGS